MSDDLIAFLRARIDEDEATAKAATPGPWCWEATGDKDSSWAAGLVQDEDGNVLTGEIGKGEGVIIDGVCESIDGNPADGAHIARHDPAREPREVAFKRAILGEHAPSPAGHAPGSTGCSVCITSRAGWQEDWTSDRWPCQTLRHLATVYSDHPDYRQEWATATPMSNSW
jgi:hypothetical protein